VGAVRRVVDIVSKIRASDPASTASMHTHLTDKNISVLPASLCMVQAALFEELCESDIEVFDACESLWRGERRRRLFLGIALGLFQYGAGFTDD
jgi:hypothetical protein